MCKNWESVSEKVLVVGAVWIILVVTALFGYGIYKDISGSDESDTNGDAKDWDVLIDDLTIYGGSLRYGPDNDYIGISPGTRLVADDFGLRVYFYGKYTVYSYDYINMVTVNQS